jgi:drug/metabolite transporter (DMT)-like permease
VFGGILFIFWDGINDLANPDYRFGILLLLFAIAGWASGTIFTKKMNIQSKNISLNLLSVCICRDHSDYLCFPFQ